MVPSFQEPQRVHGPIKNHALVSFASFQANHFAILFVLRWPIQNKQKLVECGLRPNQLWETLVSMDAGNTPPHPSRRREKWWEANALSLIWSFSCLRKLERFDLSKRPPASCPHQEQPRNGNIYYLTSSKEGVKTANCIGLSLDSCFFVF